MIRFEFDNAIEAAQMLGFLREPNTRTEPADAGELRRQIAALTGQLSAQTDRCAELEAEAALYLQQRNEAQTEVEWLKRAAGVAVVARGSGTTTGFTSSGPVHHVIAVPTAPTAQSAPESPKSTPDGKRPVKAAKPPRIEALPDSVPIPASCPSPSLLTEQEANHHAHVVAGNGRGKVATAPGFDPAWQQPDGSMKPMTRYEVRDLNPEQKQARQRAYWREKDIERGRYSTGRTKTKSAPTVAEPDTEPDVEPDALDYDPAWQNPDGTPKTISQGAVRQLSFAQKETRDAALRRIYDERRKANKQAVIAKWEKTSRTPKSAASGDASQEAQRAAAFAREVPGAAGRLLR